MDVVMSAHMCLRMRALVYVCLGEGCSSRSLRVRAAAPLFTT